MPRSEDADNSETGAGTRDQVTGAHTRGEPTRQRIVDAALALFREHGYDGTTMRAIANGACVPLGNAYYYVAGKQELLDALAEQLHVEYLQACRPVLEHERDLKARLGGVLAAYWTTRQRFEPVAAELLMLGANPRSPLNPFGIRGAQRREAEIALFAEVAHGSRTTIHPEIAPILPTLLWLYHVGLQRAWLHDSTPNHERTQRLTETSVDEVVEIIKHARDLRPLRRGLVQACIVMGIPDAAAKVSTGEG